MYMSNVILDIEKNILTRSKIKKCKNARVTIQKVSDTDFKILGIGDHQEIMKNNYNVKQLKQMLSFYELKKTGTKRELTDRLYRYLYESLYARRIQDIWKKYLCIELCKLRGPGRLNREVCVNETDFFSLDNLKNIPYKQFISFECQDDKKVYGFDINSLYHLLASGSNMNPYTRKVFPDTMKRNVNKLIRFSSLVGENIEFKKNDEEELSPLKRLELQSVNLFQIIDNLGNLTNHNWFWSLGRVQLIRFIRELADIWGYRAQLSGSTKREICPPDGNPFRSIDLPSLPSKQVISLRRMCLDIMECMVKRGTNHGAQSLGANYVLCALTLVNADAAEALPWLYEAVVSN